MGSIIMSIMGSVIGLVLGSVMIVKAAGHGVAHEVNKKEKFSPVFGLLIPLLSPCDPFTPTKSVPKAA